MNVAKLGREDAPPRYDASTPSGARTSSLEAAARWFAISVALALAVAMGIWLQK